MCALLIAELDTQYAPLVLLRASRAKPPEPSVAATSGAELTAALTADHVDQFFKVSAPSAWVVSPRVASHGSKAAGPACRAAAGYAAVWCTVQCSSVAVATGFSQSPSLR